MADEQAANAQAQGEQQFALQKIYTKDMSFESPASPGVFRQQWQPQVNVEVNTKSSAIDSDGNFEVVLSLTITAKAGEDTAFLIEVQQAGIFLVRGLEDEERRRLLGSAAPNLLFPYARETIDSLCVKGGFPPLMVAPINFDAVYQQARTQAQQGDAAASN
jgi:preprotein translocase subunit SecB